MTEKDKKAIDDTVDGKALESEYKNPTQDQAIGLHYYAWKRKQELDYILDGSLNPFDKMPTVEDYEDVLDLMKVCLFVLVSLCKQ